MSELLTPQEVAERLAVHQNTVYRWVKDGRLRAYHLGGGKSARVRIAGDDLAKMLRESG